MSQSSGTPVELPADLQRQIDVSAYVFAGSTGVFIWDILNNLRSDYILLFKQKIHPVSVAYVTSRIASLVYVLGFTIFASYPLRACNTAYVAFNIFYPIGVSATAFLFFFRVRGIYGGERLATIIFGFLWLAVLGSSITIPFGGSVVSFGDPPECIVAHVEAYVGAAGIIITVHDTLVFFAISYRLVSNFSGTQQETRVVRFKSFFSGANLPSFSKALFTDGQMYYLITVAINIVATLLIYIPVSPVYHGIMVVPNVTLTSIMACRVYRNTKLGIARGSSGGALSIPTLNPNPTIPLSVVHFSPARSELTHSSGRSEPTDHSTGDEHKRDAHMLSPSSASAKADDDAASEIHHDTGVVP